MDRRYFVTFGACLVQFVVIGLLFSYGLFFKVFEDEFGWSRTFLSACSSIAFLMMGVLAMPGGRLSDLYGPRVVLAFSGVLYGVGFVLMSQISEPWHLFVIFALFVGLGMSTHDVVTLSTIARWFSRRRGIMTGVVKLGTAAGQVVLPLLAAFLIAGFGWQVALITLGVAASVVLLIAAFLMARPPQAEVQKSTEDAAGLTLAEARSGRVMWTLCLLQFLFLTVLTTIPTHIAVHGMDMGLSRVEAGGLLSVIGASSAIGRLIVGGFADRIGGRGGYLFCFSGLILALGILVLTFGSTSLIPILAIYGCVHGGLFTVVSPTVAEYFGTRAHGAIFGVILFFGTIGGALGPVLAGWTFDVTGTYIWAFSTLLAFSIIGFVLTLSLPRPTGKAKT